MKNALRHPRGTTLIETAIATAILAILAVAIGMALSSQADVFGRAVDHYNVNLPATAVLDRIRDELKQTTREPQGVTPPRAFAVSPSGITFTPIVRFIAASDGNFASLKSAGRVSSNNILYETYSKSIAFDATLDELRLRITGTAPTGMKTNELLASGVEDFAFFDARSNATPPAAPSLTNTFVLGVRIRLRRVSAVPGARGANVFSDLPPLVNPVSPSSAELVTKYAYTAIKFEPEALVNTNSILAVGP